MRDVTNYQGVKYSLQPHGLKSKFIYYFAAFVIAFGGALAVASPAEGNTGDCFVETTTPSPNPSGSPDPSPMPTLSPTSCSSPSPSPTTVTTTVTKKVTVYVDQTTTRTETVTITPSPTEYVPSFTPSALPTPTLVASTGGGGSLVGWAIGTVIAVGSLLALVGGIGMVRGRRRQRQEYEEDTQAAAEDASPGGRHRVDNSETMMIPVIRDHDMSDYGPDAEFDPALGGHAGESYQQRPESDTAADADTKPLPRVE